MAIRSRQFRRPFIHWKEETGHGAFARDRSGIRLTKDGEAFLPYFQAVGTAEKALEEKKKEMAGLTRAVIRIGTFTSVSRNLLVPLIHDFEEIYPEARFGLRQGNMIRCSRYSQRSGGFRLRESGICDGN